MKQIKKTLLSAKQQGFTFIEMVIVVIMIGIMAIIMIMFIGGGMSAAARSEAMFDTAGKFASSWAMLCKEAGTKNSLGATAAPGTGNTSILIASGSSASNILRFGRTEVAASFQSAYDRSGIVPMPDIMTGDKTWGGQQMFGYTVYVIGNGSNGAVGNMIGPFVLYFKAVPDDVVLQLVQKYGSGAAALAAGGDASNAVIEYGVADASGRRDVSIIKYI
jgi:prepilin-type N-terminal cleavage/methylation domain-containing protein